MSKKSSCTIVTYIHTLNEKPLTCNKLDILLMQQRGRQTPIPGILLKTRTWQCLETRFSLNAVSIFSDSDLDFQMIDPKINSHLCLDISSSLYHPGTTHKTSRKSLHCNFLRNVVQTNNCNKKHNLLLSRR